MNNVYGTSRPAIIKDTDIEIFYHYRPDRSSDDSSFVNFKKIDSALLSSLKCDNDNNTSFVLPGAYNLRLPVNIFNKKGVYTVYIKPKEIKTTIIDVSTLASHPDIKGIVIDGASIESEILTTNGSLVGYRVEYFDEQQERTEDFRIITSNNHCEPVAQNLNDPMQKGIRYRFNENSPLIFCTLTPSSTMSFKSNSVPYIGKSAQTIALINTKFEPIMMEIELVEHDIETVSTMLEGDQLRNLENNTITTFGKNGAIYHQASCGTIIDPETGLAHDFKTTNDLIDFNEDISIVKNNL